jgi:CelD/BcsL family acetyltransferase involved in cellulose biosynthesis
MNLEAVELTLSDPTWDLFVKHHRRATAFHHPAWARLLAETYAYRPRVLAAVSEANRIVGGLPVLDVSRPFGLRRWVSLPFTDYCPVLADDGAETPVASAIVGLASARHLGALELRAALAADDRVRTSVHAVRHTLNLADEPAAVLARISKHHRRNIRRAEQAQVRVRLGVTSGDMAVFYRLHLLTRRRLGVPVQPWHFFDALAGMLDREQLGFVLVAYVDESPVAAAVFLAWNGVLIYKYGASDAAFWAHRPNNLLFWHAIRWGCEHRYTTLDWGRTDFDNLGLREFKTGWGATEEPLAYSVIGRGLVPKSSTGRMSRALSSIIRRSPTWVCRALGEVLYRYAA